ncbi:MAG: hypothetical protein AAFR84_03000 [Pseudomonadota bacterium]
MTEVSTSITKDMRAVVIFGQMQWVGRRCGDFIEAHAEATTVADFITGASFEKLVIAAGNQVNQSRQPELDFPEADRLRANALALNALAKELQGDLE